MVDQVISLLDLSAGDTVLDLFCGSGNFTLPIARYVKNVTGVEGSEEMVNRAKKNAEKNGLLNSGFIVCDLSGQDADVEFTGRDYNKVLLDPSAFGRPGNYRKTEFKPGGKAGLRILQPCNTGPGCGYTWCRKGNWP